MNRNIQKEMGVYPTYVYALIALAKSWHHNFTERNLFERYSLRTSLTLYEKHNI